MIGPMEAPQASEKYYLAFGALPIDLRPAVGDADKSTVCEEAEEFVIREVDSIYRRVLSTLRNSPYITGVDAQDSLGAYTICHFGHLSQHRVLVLSEPLLIRCDYPEDLQCLSSFTRSALPPDQVDSSPAFEMLYNGVCFAYYRRVNRPSGVPCGAEDARKLLAETLGDFNIVKVFPNPLRVDFLVNMDSVAGVAGPRVTAIDEYTVEIDNFGLRPEELVRFLFYRVALNLMEFYSLCHSSDKVGDIAVDLYDISRSILSKRFEGISANILDLPKRRSAAKDLEKLIQRFHVAHTLYLKSRNDLVVETRQWADHLTKLLRPISRDLLCEIEAKEPPMAAYINVEQLGQNYVDGYAKLTSLWLTVATSLVSAIIGGLIGAALSG